MLSYQHAFHAGNLADLHKHALLAWMLDYLTAKPKPLSYLETHSGRGLYDLSGPEAEKTGEARVGIGRALDEGWLPADHPLARALAPIRARHGDSAYPGSPLIARHFLRPGDNAHLAELHPTEHEALSRVAGFAHLHRQDGFAMAQALCPPTPRRGLLLIDPSYEIKTDYQTVVEAVAAAHRRFPSGTYLLWYPVIERVRTERMLDALRATGIRRQFRVELGLVADAAGRGMTAAGIVAINPPWTLPHAASAGLPWLAKALGATGPLAAAWLAPPEA